MSSSTDADTAMDAAEPSESGSRRVSDARSRAQARLNRQRDTLRPLGWAVIAVVTINTAGGHPGPRVRGTGLGVTLALAAFAAMFALAVTEGFVARRHAVQAAVLVVMGAAGVGLAGLQPQGATELAGGAAVWMAAARLPLPMGAVLGSAITAALDVAVVLSGGSASAVFAATLLCALLALVACFLKQSRESQDRTEVLLAELEDAREEQTRAAAIAERGRIAGELHDVLAHSLSGAAIQLQGARMLADRDDASPQMQTAIDRASELVKDGLANAKQAVGALRGEQMPGVAQLPSLVDSVRDDLKIELTLDVEGTARQLPAEASLALYRGAQEALTNIARYAHGAHAVVVLRYGDGRTSLRIENARPGRGVAPSRGGGLGDVGGGRGLAGLRERLQRVGGSMTAGPTDGGWRVDIEIPA